MKVLIILNILQKEQGGREEEGLRYETHDCPENFPLKSFKLEFDLE